MKTQDTVCILPLNPAVIQEEVTRMEAWADRWVRGYPFRDYVEAPQPAVTAERTAKKTAKIPDNYIELIAKERADQIGRDLFYSYMSGKHTLMDAMAGYLSMIPLDTVEYEAALQAVKDTIQKEAMFGGDATAKEEVLRGVQQQEWKLRKEMLQRQKQMKGGSVNVDDQAAGDPERAGDQGTGGERRPCESDPRGE